MDARYIKILVKNMDCHNGGFAEFAELRAKTADGANVALNKTAIYSSQYGVGWYAPYILDGNTGTAWASSGAYMNEYAGVDLGNVYDITAVEVVTESSWNNVLTAYDILISTDGINYSTVKSYSGLPVVWGRLDITPFEPSATFQCYMGGM
jgi:F5/8 type C domain.